MKKIGALALVIIMLMLSISMYSCSGRAPELEDVKDRFIYLIENSKEINILFFGDGLPIYEREDTLSGELGIYYNDEYTAFDRVMENSRYLSVDDMKEQAEKVYCEKYLKAIYETAFEGYMVGSASAYMRFYETTDWLYQSTHTKKYDLADRIFDYSSMEIVKPSDGNYVNVKILSYTLEDRQPKEDIFSFTYERGDWYLDSPTY